MATTRALVVEAFLLVMLRQAALAFRWTSGIKPWAGLIGCVGDNVTFPWSYVTDNEENVTNLSWWSRKKGCIANYTSNTFTTSLSYLRQAGNAGITLSDVTREDDDTYGVIVSIEGAQEAMTQNITLTVFEPPTTADGQLHLEVYPENASLFGGESGSRVRLDCGRFLSSGWPRVSVVWKDPIGRYLPSTYFQDGVFSLQLPPFAKGGNYTCSTFTKSARCLPSDSPLVLGASVLVETIATNVTQQVRVDYVTGDVGQLQDAEDSLNTTMTQNHQEHSQLSHDIQKLLHRVAEMGTAGEGQADTEKNLDTKVNQQLHTKQYREIQTSSYQSDDSDEYPLISSLQNEITQLKKAKEEQDKQLQNILHIIEGLNTNEISSLQKQVSDQNTQISRLQEQVSDQNKHISGLQKQVSEQNTQIAGLQKQIINLENHTADQNTHISSLQDQVSDHNTQIPSLHNQTTDHKMQISSLQKQSLNQTIQISGLQNQTTDQNIQTSSLQHDISRLHNQTTNQITEISTVQNQILGLQNQTIEQHIQISILKNQANDQKTQISSLKDQISRLQNQSTDHNTQFSSLLIQVSDYNTRISSLQNQTIDHHTQISTIQKQNTDQNSKISGLQNQVSDHNTQISSLQNQTTDYNTELCHLQNLFSSLQNQSTNQETQISSLQNQATDQKNKLSSLQDQTNGIQNQTTALQADVRRDFGRISLLTAQPRFTTNTIITTTTGRVDDGTASSDLATAVKTTNGATTMAATTSGATTTSTNAATTTSLRTTAATTTSPRTTAGTTTFLRTTGATTTSLITTDATTTSPRTNAATTTSLRTTAATKTFTGNNADSATSTGAKAVAEASTRTRRATRTTAETTVATTVSKGTTVATTVSKGTTVATTVSKGTTVEALLEIRLVGGPRGSAGRVELYINGQWGTVCDDDFGLEEARVTCRMLGYTEEQTPTVYGGSYFGQGAGQIWLDDVGCQGSESNLLSCRHNGVGNHDCGHHEDVGVDCTPPDTLEVVEQDCGTGWMFIHRACYRFSSEALSWDDALLSCQTEGGYLLSISDVSEKNKMRAEVRKLDSRASWWIGLKHKGGNVWEWQDKGSPFSTRFTPWDDAQPFKGGMQDCVDFNSNGRISDDSCATAKAFICERHEITQRPQEYTNPPQAYYL